MLASFRSALLMVAALTATIIAPAQAGPSGEPCSRWRARLFRRSRFPTCSIRRASRNPDPTPETPSTTDRRRRRCSAPAVKPTGDLADDGRAAARLRRRQPRARMPGDRHLFRIEERAARRPAGRRARSSPTAPKAAAVSRHLLRRAVPARPVLVRSRPFAADACRTPTVSGRPPSRSPRSSTRASRTSAVGDALFFHARYVSPGWRLKRVASIGNHIFYR